MPSSPLSSVLQIRISEELELKRTLETRAQFIVATGATITTLGVSAFVFAESNGVSFQSNQLWLLVGIAVFNLAGVLTGTAVVLPLPYSQLDDRTLEPYVNDSGLGGLDDELAKSRYSTLVSLSDVNRFKSLMLTLGSIGLAAGATCACFLLVSMFTS